MNCIDAFDFDNIPQLHGNQHHFFHIEFTVDYLDVWRISPKMVQFEKTPFENEHFSGKDWDLKLQDQNSFLIRLDWSKIVD